MRYTVFPLLRGCGKEEFQRAVNGFSLYLVAECGSLCYLNAASDGLERKFWRFRGIEAPYNRPPTPGIARQVLYH